MNASSGDPLNADSSGGAGRPADSPFKSGGTDESFDAIWDVIILGGSKFSSEKTCYELADEYRGSGKTTRKCVVNFLDGQKTDAGEVGFMLSAPGFMSMRWDISNDSAACVYLQLRAAAVIALLCGWDVKSDQVKTIALHSMAEGSNTGAMAQGAGKAAEKIAGAWLQSVPGSVIAAINRELGFRCITKYGYAGLINLVELVSVCGGLASGGVNAVLTNQAGWVAYRALKSGPGNRLIDGKFDEVKSNEVALCATKGARTEV